MTTPHITHTSEEREEVQVSHQLSLEERDHLMREITNRRLRRFLWIEQILWFLVGTVELFLGFRLVLKFMVANPQSPFARFMFDITHPLAAPFMGLTSNPETAGRVVDAAALSAMIVYLIGAALLDRILWFFIVRSPRTEP